jgi:guanylate kinase
MEKEELLILVIANNELKTKMVFEPNDKNFNIDKYIEEQAEDCALSNETFAYCIVNKDELPI